MAEKRIEGKKQNPFVKFLKFLFPWKGDSTAEVIRKIIFIISIAALIVCGVYFGNRLYQRHNYKNTSNLSGLVDDSSLTGGDGKLQKYKNLLKINKEFVGWLKIDGTGVDVPVVQTDNNTTYLRKDFYGNYSVYGNPFLDYRNDLKKIAKNKKSKSVKLDRNITVYGHNMLDDMVFAELLKYKELSYYKQHPTVQFNTIYGETDWKIISCFLINSTDDQDGGYCLPYNFVDCADKNYSSYLTELAKRTYVSTCVDVDENDVLLTLSTCDKKIIPEGRFVVVARLVRDGESKTVDTTKAAMNSNIKFPQGYYTKKGISNPYAGENKWQPYD